MTEFPAGYIAAITGAGSGIGAATCSHLLARGVTVLAYDRDRDGLQRLADRHRDPRLLTAELDLTDDAAVSSAVQAALAQQQRLDALINCVGINPDAGTPSHLVDLDVFDTVYRVNLRSALVLTRAVLPAMLEAGYGRIAHVASIAGKEGNPRMASYSASKAGLIGLVKALGREYADTGVTINALAPAVIRTPMVEATPPDVVEAMLSRIPMGRPGELSEVAAMLAMIASPGCSYTTGFTFDLSGGRATY
jgi:2-dehydro-3-deoxy-L-rhamnonate dehydrogenase (NAD+)